MFIHPELLSSRFYGHNIVALKVMQIVEPTTSRSKGKTKLARRLLFFCSLESFGGMLCRLLCGGLVSLLRNKTRSAVCFNFLYLTSDVLTTQMEGKRNESETAEKPKRTNGFSAHGNEQRARYSSSLGSEDDVEERGAKKQDPMGDLSTSKNVSRPWSRAFCVHSISIRQPPSKL